MWVIATSPTLPSASSASNAAMSSSPASVIGRDAQLDSPFVAQHLPGHDVGVVLHSRDQHRLPRPQDGASIAVRDEVDRLGAVAGEHDLAAVGGAHQVRRPLRAPPRRRRWCARSSNAGRDARSRTASPSRSASPRSPTRGFCAEAALSRKTSGLPRTFWRRIGKSSRMRVTSSPVIWVIASIMTPAPATTSPPPPPSRARAARA